METVTIVSFYYKIENTYDTQEEAPSENTNNTYMSRLITLLFRRSYNTEYVKNSFKWAYIYHSWATLFITSSHINY